MRNTKLFSLHSLLVMSLFAASALAQKAPPRDQFFWLGEINKATAVINTDEGLLDKTKTHILRRVSSKCWKTAPSQAPNGPSG